MAYSRFLIILEQQSHRQAMQNASFPQFPGTVYPFSDPAPYPQTNAGFDCQ